MTNKVDERIKAVFRLVQLDYDCKYFLQADDIETAKEDVLRLLLDLATALTQAVPEKQLSYSIPPGMPESMFARKMGYDAAIDATHEALESVKKSWGLK